ncbi:GNAT family N-acetyltransferase [Arthrobacter sp. FW306-2-2C-D06B]|uniref:GNAT family N-acetyltransferase n=1 Tax=Arthrobacter sp. FW306-2-2C-D06B TaxID=2879618 RepID=UPI001F24C97F|nr:GNAT family N-acetyltransferase [Arthrobacter sp. FW306-2-2C-D06B]UKA60856.1 GNAT family N-acetyltransferase [Arthrobacter sp. FW306-2-2C-D06B]
MSLASIEELMDRAWPAPDREDTGGWVMRAAGGVTQRANSVWPREQASDHESAVRAATQWYRSRRLPLIFQAFDDERSAGLNAVLDAQRFTRQSETLIMVRPGGIHPYAPRDGWSNDVEISEEPSEEWLRLWWSVDGRGGDAELEIARKILVSCPSVYALVRDDDGAPAAVGRLALVDGKGGVYCMATAAGHRRRGFGQRVLDALLTAGSRRGVAEFWLLVMASNTGAQALYEGAGFTERGRYLYRQARPQRALSGC